MTAYAEGQTLIREQVLITEICCSEGCGIMFAWPTDARERALADHFRWFYCPNGHRQHFTGQTEETRLRQKLQRETEAREAAERRARVAQERVLARNRSIAAYKGALTKMRNRMANGVCPVQGCKRSGFSNVRRHIEMKHDGWLGDHPELKD